MTSFNSGIAVLEKFPNRAAVALPALDDAQPGMCKAAPGFSASAGASAQISPASAGFPVSRPAFPAYGARVQWRAVPCYPRFAAESVKPAPTRLCGRSRFGVAKARALAVIGAADACYSLLTNR